MVMNDPNLNPIKTGSRSILMDLSVDEPLVETAPPLTLKDIKSVEKPGFEISWQICSIKIPKYLNDWREGGYVAISFLIRTK